MASDEKTARYSAAEEVDTDERLEQDDGHEYMQEEEFAFREHVDSVSNLPRHLRDHVLFLQSEVARLTRANRGLQMQRVRVHRIMMCRLARCIRTATAARTPQIFLPLSPLFLFLPLFLFSLSFFALFPSFLLS